MISFEFPNLIQYCQRITALFKEKKFNRIPLPKPFYNQVTDKSKEYIKSACNTVVYYDYKSGVNQCKETIINCKDTIINYNYKENIINCKDNIINHNYKEDLNQCREYVSNHKISFAQLKESIMNFDYKSIPRFFTKSNTSNMSYYEKDAQNKKQLVNSRVLSVVGALSFFTFYIVHNRIIRIDIKPEHPIPK